MDMNRQFIKDKLDFDNLIQNYKVKNNESFLNYCYYLFYDISIKTPDSLDYLDKHIFSQVNYYIIISITIFL
jgi:hypothetical protein